MHRRQKIFLSIPVLFAAFFLGNIPLFVSAQTEKGGRPPSVRIVLSKDAVQVSVGVRGPYQIVDPLTGKVLEEGRRLPLTMLTSAETGIKFGKNLLTQSRIRVASDKDIEVRLNGKDRRYRQSIDIIRTPQNRLLVANHLGLEDYIKGVLYHEVSHRWPMEAIKAQAVAARTYALYRISESAGQDFDVTDDIYSQVYGGRDSERYRTNLAVDATKDEIVIYNGKIFPAYFHATCGGFTEDADELWKKTNLPPLKGVRCSFCLYSPHMFWKKNFRLKDIQDKLNGQGYNIGLIEEIRVKERDHSGRIENLEIVARDEKTSMISGKDFRNIVGPNDIRSNNYRIKMKGYYADFIGRGWGHGVGLCQWGALGMAQEGHNYKGILEYYYPGTQLIHVKVSPEN